MEFQLNWMNSKWFLALSLPTLEWATPFLPLMDLPQKIIEQPEILRAIHTKAITELEKKRKERVWELAEENTLENVKKEVFTSSLQDLAMQMGLDVAIDFEAWIIFHCMCNEFRMAMFEWGIVLSYAYLREDSRRGRRKISPPDVLVPLLPEIYDFINFERRKLLTNNLMEAAPAPSYEQIPYERLEKCFEATMLDYALEQALTFKALQIIAARLDSSQQHQVLKWTQAQLISMDSRHGYRHSQKLCGDKYLKLRLRDLNYPSVLTMK